jgi:modulator of FtsH protease HflK
MPWTDHSKPASRPGPWDAPDAASPEATSPAGRADAPPVRDEEKPARRRQDGRRDQPPPPPRGPHLRELGQDLRRRLGQIASRPTSRRTTLAVLATVSGVVAAAWLACGVRVIRPNEVGVETRFGAFQGVLAPGLHYRLPPPIDHVRRISFDTVDEVSFGTNGDADGVPALTREGGPVTLALVVQWRVVDPVRYAFGAPDPAAVVRTAAESAVQQAVGRRSMAELVGTEADASADAAARLQALLDRYGVGVSVSGLQIKAVSPPEAAQGGFRDLVAAKADTDAARRDAAVYRGRVLADARGEAAAALHEAEAVQDREVAEAKGEADRFALVDQAYRKAPDVTRERLYTEAMARVLHDTNKIVLPSSKGAPVALPPELFRVRTGRSQASSDPAPPQPSGSTP